MKKVLEEKYLKQLEEIEKNGDIEARHGKADDALIALLKEAGYEKVAQKFFDMAHGFWYA